MSTGQSRQSDSETTAVEVLLVGRLAGADRTVSDAVANLAGCRFTATASIAEAVPRLRSGLAPQLLVVAQDWPGQVQAGELDQLRRAAPLAAICLLLGSWCEGETRSGRPWPGAVRCYWHQWPARFPQAIGELAAGRKCCWDLPATALPEETPLGTACAETARGGLLAIIAAEAESGAALSDAARARGYETVSLRSVQGAAVQGAAAALWDTRPETAADRHAVREVLSAVGHAPLIAIAGFPRPEDVERARAAGVAAVVSKPLLVRDLFWQLEQLR